uniref:MHC class I-like antigen recognition-like domain-containing protein n=1 Tax=Spermophilus dauricus TaxID=99837 RepID=A0A8C9ULS9_SPEDA
MLILSNAFSTSIISVLPFILLMWGTHSLCYDFTINSKPAPGQQWCTVQGQVDQKNFLSYDCGLNKVKSMSALGGKVNATINWEEQKTLLRDIGNTLKQKLADIKAENDMARGLNTLEGRMCCQHKSNSSWQFGFNGQMWLLFDSDNRRWREIHPGSNWMKEMWENDKEVTELLHRSSIGDCRTWIQNLKEWEAELEPTDTLPLIYILTYSCLLYLLPFLSSTIPLPSPPLPSSLSTPSTVIHFSPLYYFSLSPHFLLYVILYNPKGLLPFPSNFPSLSLSLPPLIPV